ncbi:MULTISPECIES: HAD-IA family hydrolase [Cellulomonas]|uniref:HAD-IA family hydrolase n=1 Tax=Cellulomonas TaxID=1707 RepID=UPI00114279DC|nr:MULTISPECIES: HAD-IA family hydrolase [Cellulomonas]MCR6703369.1 HAD-IA family hydrolase [Cellulomonas sp.]
MVEREPGGAGAVTSGAGAAVRGIEAVLLDLGNVLVGWDPYRAFAGRMPLDAVEAFFAEVDFAHLNSRQDAGRPWAHARAELEQSTPQHVPALDLYVAHFDDALTGPVPGTAAIVEDLIAGGVRVLGLTNWSAQLYHHAVPAAAAIGLLEDVLVSGDVGLVKPDPAIFRLAARRFGLDPARTLFVDDSAANVAAAADEGFDAVLFTDADALRTELVARGLVPSAG